MTKIKVRFKGDNPNSGYGFYQAGDVGTVVGYTQGLAVVVKEDGTFVKTELSHIVEMEEDTTQELEPFFKKGTWYKCVEFIGINEFRFEKNCQYYCKYDNTLTQLRYGHNYTCIFREGDRNTCLEHFRPATEEEVAVSFLPNLASEQKDVPPEIQQVINAHFDEMFDEEPELKNIQVIKEMERNGKNWKPSEEQIKLLEKKLNGYLLDAKEQNILLELLEQLKAL